MDFAGSAVVHALGGWSALAAVLVLGPRQGRFNANGSMNVMPGHNLPMAALGAFILWFGWFGFNPGSTLSGMDSNIAKIAVNTNLSAAAGGTVAALLTLFQYGKADLSMALNGALGGLVAITAGCAFVTPVSSLVIGAAAGALIVLAVPFFDRLRADDPVGAIAVHGVCGTFGTLAVGIFAQNGGLLYGGGVHQLLIQLLGVTVIGLWGFGATYALFSLLGRHPCHERGGAGRTRSQRAWHLSLYGYGVSTAAAHAADAAGDGGIPAAGRGNGLAGLILRGIMT
jgi:Amt family ammonium transporter